MNSFLTICVVVGAAALVVMLVCGAAFVVLNLMEYLDDFKWQKQYEEKMLKQGTKGKEGK